MNGLWFSLEHNFHTFHRVSMSLLSERQTISKINKTLEVIFHKDFSYRYAIIIY